ncbi:hypothetical protein ACFL5O_12215 [Myxococcota bacterium]
MRTGGGGGKDGKWRTDPGEALSAVCDGAVRGLVAAAKPGFVRTGSGGGKDGGRQLQGGGVL